MKKRLNRIKKINRVFALAHNKAEPIDYVLINLYSSLDINGHIVDAGNVLGVAIYDYNTSELQWLSDEGSLMGQAIDTDKTTLMIKQIKEYYGINYEK